MVAHHQIIPNIILPLDQDASTGEKQKERERESKIKKMIVDDVRICPPSPSGLPLD